VIVGIDGHPVRLENDLGKILAAYRPGQIVKLAVVRGQARRTVSVKLTTRPGSP
jgi:S1-C subfamily serine protease